MKNKKVIVLIVISLLFVFAIPLIIDWIIIGNDIQSNISNSDWVGFLGDYIGAIIGALVSLAGIVITIKFTANQNQKDREEQIKPYCAIRYIERFSSKEERIKTLGEVQLEFFSDSGISSLQRFFVFVKNVGLGPAINFDLSLEDIDSGRKHYIEIKTHSMRSSWEVDSLQSGEEGLIFFGVLPSLDPIEKENVIEVSPGNYKIKECAENKYKDFDVVINLSYEDVYRNRFVQKITLSVDVTIIVNVNNGTAEYEYTVRLKEATAPQKITSKGHKNN